MKVDLHCHTHCSDGELSPVALIEKARTEGVQLLAITDHDSIDAYRELEHLLAEDSGAEDFSLYSGVEFSTQWGGHEIHIVGLDFDLEHRELIELIKRQKEKRQTRARSIAKKLEKEGVENAYEGARAVAAGEIIARPHFAQYLIDIEFVKDQKQAFDRYLGIGKSCYQKPDWPDITEVTAAIKGAGGYAVLAHPTRYKMTATKLRRLVAFFVEADGDAIEFVGGAASKDSQQFLKLLCQQHDLMASPASDFHSEKQVWQSLGRVGEIPSSIKQVWECFSGACTGAAS
jgi:predicted metal-dependent phosphoesterase TrpH